jgi:anti-sigma regulatory factor (Ser/Thr protein kinase)
MPSARSRERPDAGNGTAPGRHFRDRELRLVAAPEHLAQARAWVGAAVAEFGLTDRQRHDFVFAANEAVTNAIRHGAPDADGAIAIAIAADGDGLSLTVSDCGAWVSAVPDLDPLAEGGRGFILMARLVDEIELSAVAGRTRVRLLKRRSPTPGAGGAGS